MLTVGQELISLFAADPATYPTRSLFPARAHEPGKVRLSLIFSRQVAVGDTVAVSCEGAGAYDFQVDDRLSFDIINRTDLVAIPVPHTAQAHGSHALELTVGGTLPIDKGVTTIISFWTVPRQGINNWGVETRTGVKISNTNDKSMPGFEAVTPLEVLIQAVRAPPRTTVTVRLSVTGVEEGVIVPELLLVAPPTFVFPLDCGEICAAREDTYGSDKRVTATLTSRSMSTLLGLDLTFFVLTPSHSPPDLIWIVEAQGLASNKLGWGSTRGFEVDQMSDVSIQYIGIASLRATRVAVTFTLGLEAGSRIFTTIELLAPANFSLSCRGSGFAAVALPGGSPDCEQDGGDFLRLSLNETMTAETYCFIVEADLPERTPAANTFALLVRERATDQIIDAAFGVQGRQILPLALTQPSIAWSTAGYGGQSSVTLGFTFTGSYGDLRSLLVLLPRNFRQNVRLPADFKLTNSKLPLLKGASDWLDSSASDRLRLRLDPSDPVVAEGSYRLVFPVLLPASEARVPRVNLWQLLLCGDWQCGRRDDPGVLVAAPLLGFRGGEASALEALRVARRSDQASGAPGLAMAWAALAL